MAHRWHRDSKRSHQGSRSHRLRESITKPRAGTGSNQSRSTTYSGPTGPLSRTANSATCGTESSGPAKRCVCCTVLWATTHCTATIAESARFESAALNQPAFNQPALQAGNAQPAAAPQFNYLPAGGQPQGFQPSNVPQVATPPVLASRTANSLDEKRSIVSWLRETVSSSLLSSAFATKSKAMPWRTIRSECFRFKRRTGVPDVLSKVPDLRCLSFLERWSLDSLQFLSSCAIEHRSQ